MLQWFRGNVYHRVFSIKENAAAVCNTPQRGKIKAHHRMSMNFQVRVHVCIMLWRQGRTFLCGEWARH